MSKQTPEQKTREEVLKYLKKRGHWVLPHRTEAPLIKTRAGLMRGSFNERYATEGEADLLVFAKDCPTFPIWIELKKKGKRKIDPKQVEFRERAKCMGHEYYAVNCEQDCIDMGL